MLMCSVWLLVQGMTGNSMSYYSLYNQNGRVHCLSARQPWKWHRKPAVTAMHHWWASYIIPLIKKTNSHLLDIALPELKIILLARSSRRSCVCVCMNEWENTLQVTWQMSFVCFCPYFRRTEWKIMADHWQQAYWSGLCSSKQWVLQIKWTQK